MAVLVTSERSVGVLGMVVGRGAVWTLAGVGIGLVGRSFLTRFLASLLFGIRAVVQMGPAPQKYRASGRP
jgi:hypothetical protein